MIRLGPGVPLVLACAAGLAGCGAHPRTVAVQVPAGPRSADHSPSVTARAVAERAVLDAAAVAQLRGGFHTRVGGSGWTVVESVEGESTLLHTLRLGDPVVAARWFGEAWTEDAAESRGLSEEGVVTSLRTPPGSRTGVRWSGDAPWRVRLSGPAGFPLGDFLGRWSHPPSGPSFEGWSGSGIRTPPVPGGGGNAWLPEATLRVEPAVGRWWIQDASGREVWSRSSVPVTLGAEPAPGVPAFWFALSEALDRRLASGPVRVLGEPWRAAFAAADRVRGEEAEPRAAAEAVLSEVLR